MVNSLENIDKSKVYVDRIEGLNEVVEDVISNTLVGAVSTITTSDLTAGKILVSDSNGKVAAGSKGINDLQDALVSGTNIKTVNGASLLGSGNIAIESGANTSLSNLTIQGQNIANWSNNVTNCITEIPQDIKLELSNGTLTLKAGSKVYVPNGVGVFDTVTIASDITGTYTTSSSQRMFFYNVNDGYFQSCPVADVYSGTTSPTGSGIIYWYDTTNNLVKRSSNGGSTWDTTVYSLSFCLCSVTNNNISSIDQVFNGFGYIGSTVFALPGVKGLIPNGRNKDGSLKNIEFSVNNVLTYTYTNSLNAVQTSIISNSSGVATGLSYRFINGTQTSGWYFNNQENIYTYNGNLMLWCDYGEISTSSGKIITFTPKTVFRAVDYNDFSNLKNTVDTNDSNAVHKTGNETITGQKTLKNTEATIANPSSNVSWRYTDYIDNNNVRIGVIGSRIDSNGWHGTYLQAGNEGNISIISDGTNVITYAPTPSVSSNNSEITTTTYINNKFQVVSTLPANPNSNIYYFIPE